MNNGAHARLLALQNADGGWGATTGRPSNTEATALAVLALDHGAGARERGLEWLAGHQRTDGSWPWTEEIDSASWATSQAILALLHDGRRPERVSRGVEWLLAEEGEGFTWRFRLREWLARRKTVDIDGTLTGWPWASGTFSWIEPTSFALLALKQAYPDRRPGRAAARIREAEELIHDRECPGGGWNYGNKRVLGVDEAPYPDTTALALLALHDVEDYPARERGLQVLDRLVSVTGSGLALSLAALCRRALNMDPAALLQQAANRFDETGFLDETRVIALAVLAGRDDAPLNLRSHA